MEIDQLSKVGIQSYQDAIPCLCLLQQGPVPVISTGFARLQQVVP